MNHLRGGTRNISPVDERTQLWGSRRVWLTRKANPSLSEGDERVEGGAPGSDVCLIILDFKIALDVEEMFH